MTSVTTPSPAMNEDASLGRTIRNIVFVAGTFVAVFYAGAYAGDSIRKESTGKIEAHEKKAEETYVRKDGAEIAEIRAMYRALNEKMDYMIRQRMR